MDFLTALFGVENHVTLAQESARAVLIFFYGLLLLRLSGRRTFGHWSALDIVVSIIVGSALGRAMTGNAPLPGTMAATAVMVALHVAIAYAVAHNSRLAHLVEGGTVTLIDHGRVDHAARRAYMISEADLAEALRQEGVDGFAGAGNVKVTTLEPSGKISVVKRDPCKPDMT
ncbi:MAG TPA: YetF domain-containing protein [Rhizomicrobium sp.]|nr:YetF domain-containing protein [Rhizomicrobium sp.]